MEEIADNRIKSDIYLKNCITKRNEDYKVAQYCFLLGAGCSRTSGIPLGSEITSLLRKLCFTREFSISSNIFSSDKLFDEHVSELSHFVKEHEIEFTKFVTAKEKYFLDKISETNLKYDENYFPNRTLYNIQLSEERIYGNWFDEYSEDPRERAKLIERLVENSNLNGDYIVLANLISQGLIHNIFTTNFDDLINESLLSCVNIKARIYSHNEMVKFLSLGASKPNIIKLHGDYLFENIKNSVDETRSLEINMFIKLREALNKMDLIVIGYGGNDHSVMCALEKIKKERPFHLMWCGRDPKNVNWRVKKLFNETKNNHFIKVSSFTHLMLRLYQINQNIKTDFIHEAEQRRDKIQTYLDNYLNDYHQQFDTSKIDTKQFKKSIENFREVASITHESYKNQNLDERLDMIMYGLKLDPNNSALLNNLGVYFMDTYEYENAKNSLNKSIKVDPNNATAIANLGLVQLQGFNNFILAEELLNQALSIDPKLTTALSFKGLLRFKQGKIKEAYKYLNKAIEISPNNPEPFCTRGIINGESGKFSQALSDYEQCLKLNHRTPFVIKNNIAVVLRRQEKFEEAERILLELISEYPFLLNAYGILALTYADKGDDQSFYKYLELALKKGLNVRFYLDDVSFNKYRSTKKFQDLLNKF